ncbi:phosphate signaling complex PhoU family protein [Tractidigestivibacter scatoligenes]|jgi:phosphate transport system protein|uniref:phosphate signaling complex PhoU family protein n=1 Tax=Tractidigestivibacter scatoligenes TaxID=1299998 RepID=UPI002F358163
MTIQTRSKLTAQLKDIEDLLVRFKDKCASDIRATGLAATGDKGAQEGLARGRKAEDRLRTSIESSCLDVLLLQQPLIGDDMRFVTGSFRIVSDLSHIDGMTRDASFLVSEVPEKATSKFTSEFTQMADATAKMVEKAIDAFCNSDVSAAQEVIQDDAAVNLIYGDVTEKLVAQIREGKSSARYLPEVLMVAKYFERIGDLAKRIASWAIFRVTGEHVTEKGVDPIPTDD